MAVQILLPVKIIMFNCIFCSAFRIQYLVRKKFTCDHECLKFSPQKPFPFILLISGKKHRQCYSLRSIGDDSGNLHICLSDPKHLNCCVERRRKSAFPSSFALITLHFLHYHFRYRLEFVLSAFLFFLLLLLALVFQLFTPVIEKDFLEIFRFRSVQSFPLSQWNSLFLTITPRGHLSFSQSYFSGVSPLNAPLAWAQGRRANRGTGAWRVA